jgi:hypothetical protein
MEGKLVFAVKDTNGRLLELYPYQRGEEFIDEIDIESGELKVEFQKVMIKEDKSINFYAKVIKNI